MPETQTYKNHARLFPLYHFWTLIPLFVYFVWTVTRLRNGITADAIMGVVLALTLLVGFVAMRVQVLTVQDRLIRLEMQHRLRAILPAELAARAQALPVKQLVALRFASDAEMPALVRDVLDGKCSTPKDIKLRVKEWQGDFLRA